MKSIRFKLFLSVSIILLVVAFLSYFLPVYFVRKDINRASVFINNHMKDIQKKLIETSSFLISYHFVENAAKFEGTTQLIEILSEKEKPKDKGLLAFAAQIATYNPQIAFVQISDQNSSVAVLPAQTHLYFPLWKTLSDGALWVKIPEKEQDYVALPQNQEKQSLLLYSLTQIENGSISDAPLQAILNKAVEEAKKNQSPYQFFEKETQIYHPRESTNQFYHYLLEKISDEIEKIALIQKLALIFETDKMTPAGMMVFDEKKEMSRLILSDEAFSFRPLIENVSPRFFFMVRHFDHEKDVDFVRQVFLDQQRTVTLGFSIISRLSVMAESIKMPIVLSMFETPLIGFTSDGSIFNPSKEGLEKGDLQMGKNINWSGAPYTVYETKIENAELSILIPENQLLMLGKFLSQVKDVLIKKISLNLLGVILISLIIALGLLLRLSKRMTQPIVLLSHASQEVGKGNYENLTLPDPQTRQDEIAILIRSFKNMVVGLRDREKIRGVLNKVVSKEVADQILKSKIELGGEERIVTMLFSDIRGFTRLSEKMDPADLIGILNDYLTHMCTIVDETHGVVDKFVGDEIMALYGAPLHIENHAQRAVEAAIRMIQELKKWNQQQRAKNKITFEVGMGIHTGLVFSGNMGAENRLNYTVIGANVNLAARLCSLAKPMQVLISEATWGNQSVHENFICQKLEPVHLKGIEEAVPLYEVLDFSMNSKPKLQ